MPRFSTGTVSVFKLIFAFLMAPGKSWESQAVKLNLSLKISSRWRDPHFFCPLCFAWGFVRLFADDEMTYSGDFGSAAGWEDEEEKEAEDTAEEAEEEEGEVDDGGYIW